MPVGWRPKTSRLEELIAEEQAKIDAMRSERQQWQPETLPQIPTQPTVPTMPQTVTPTPSPITYIPPHLPTDDEVQQVVAQIGQGNAVTPAISPTSQSPAETSLLQKGIQTFTAPLQWIGEHITEPFGAVVASPFTSPEGLTRLPNESWLDFEKRQYERLNPLLRFGIESVPWFLIPGAGQVGTATRAGVGIAGALGKAGTVGKVLGKAVEFSPWGLTEKATGKVISTVLGKKAVPAVAEVVDPIVTKITTLIKKFKPATGETLKLQHKALQERAAKLSGVFASGKYTPPEAFKVARGVLKGELPRAIAPAFEAVTKDDLSHLQGMIQNFSAWERLPFNKVATDEALGTLLSGVIPTRSQTGLLETVFGKEMVKAILSKRSLGAKVFDTTMDAAGIPKALVASFDISAPARQGILLAGEGSWWKSWKPMIKALFSEKNGAAINDSIINHPLAQYQQTAKLYIAPFSRLSAPLEQFEESFMSRFANKIPWVKASNRAYITFLNKLRSDTFNSYMGRWLKEMPEDQAIAKASKLADFINKATGRGSLGGLERSGQAQQILNASFFSPRFVMSRVQIPFSVFEKDPTVRKVIAKDLAIFFGSGMTVLTLAKLGGAKVELDPRSTDFGKIRIGKTRIDFWGGFQPMARYMSQFVIAERKSASGAISPVERLDVAGRFVKSKLSPTVGLLIDTLKGQNFIGEPMEFTSETLRREAFGKLVPMFIQDLVDATREQGLVGTGLALPSAIGASITTYPVADPREQMAQKTYGKPYDELSPAQKSDIRNLPEVRAKIRPTEAEKKSYKFYDQQLQDDQAFKEGTLTNQQWRDRMSERMTIRSYMRKQWEGKYPEPTTPEEVAQAGYYAIFEKLPENAMPDEIREAMQEAQAYLDTLSPELANYVNENRWVDSTPLMKEFKQASITLRPYRNVERQVIRLFGQRYADSPAGKALISRRRSQLRLSNRAVAQAYDKFYKQS